MTSRSSSQPRALQNAHFLDGFNVADCFDVRAIPDPPSPRNIKSCHRRRVSSAVLRPMSSRDITNRGNNQNTATTDDVGVCTKSSSSVRRKRKTLSHVPSTMISGWEQNNATNAARSAGDKEVKDTEVKPKTLEINLCYDDDSSRMARDYAKRRKKRQSLVIPTDLPFEEQNDTSINISPKPSQTSSKVGKAFFPGDFRSMQKLRNLVRGYCSLSSEAERGVSNEGREIELLTGYGLPRKMETDQVGDKSKAMLSNRRLVIQKIAPVLTQMEKRKERDIKHWENVTRCHVKKSERSGRYRYYDVQSNERVGSQEYKRRYISHLEDCRPERLEMAKVWMNKVSRVDEYTAEHHNECAINDDSIGIFQQDCNYMDYCAIQKEAFSPPRDKNLRRIERRDAGSSDTMDICDMSMSLDCGEQQSSDPSILSSNSNVAAPSSVFERSEIAEISEASSEDTDDNPQESRSPSPTMDVLPTKLTTMEVNGTIIRAVDNHEKGKSILLEARDDDGVKGGNNDTNNHTLLPFPARDSESIDPEIAAAERRLWDKIDLALHEYSNEVMNIEKRKQNRLA
ncbi:unnamed protein product [Pseudo-nitzschia multistriata]|uniref:Uncharacterized protein n=1 Tax=Pseudo-nitzschia multistriata TaxID=183589 RepID=A0A448YUS4_9STRA|nr:unnamed protein product [Pseudo-nitzschia multistriata]